MKIDPAASAKMDGTFKDAPERTDLANSAAFTVPVTDAASAMISSPNAKATASDTGGENSLQNNETNVEGAPGQSGIGLSSATCSAIRSSGRSSFGEGFEHESFSVHHLVENSVLMPWLNLAFLSPKLASSEDQLRWVAVPSVSRPLYDTLMESKFGSALERFEAKLKEIYPRSFLLRLDPKQIEYRGVCPRLVSLRDVVVHVHQILSSHFENLLEGEIGLWELTHKAYSRIPDQTRRKNRRQIDDDIQELHLMGLDLDQSFFQPNVKRVHPYQRRRTSITGLVL